jgi:hypothetical protein
LSKVVLVLNLRKMVVSSLKMVVDSLEMMRILLTVIMR